MSESRVPYGAMKVTICDLCAPRKVDECINRGDVLTIWICTRCDEMLKVELGLGPILIGPFKTPRRRR